ncbi:hypothetical protein WA026_000116 [Henosepilachna vigintioctopunctata]|uniref:Uncharacterized protein n=1 Tax=Henosepilachna vigintioctopunctata TaxID=420089 RepID=A0AAW1UWF9_9CUCU
MSYKEKSPYYLMADKAKSKTSRRKPKKRRFSESDIGEASASTIKILKKPVSTVSSAETSRVKTEDNDNKNDAAKNAEHDDQAKEREDYKASNKENNDNTNDAVKTEGTDAEEHTEKRQKRSRWKRGPDSSADVSSGSTSFHSMNSEESEQKCTKPRKKKTRSFSWTDSFDYMN